MASESRVIIAFLRATLKVTFTFSNIMAYEFIINFIAREKPVLYVQYRAVA